MTGGAGTIASANVTDVVVDCVSLPANPFLDPAFGVGGVTTTAGVGAAVAVTGAPDGSIYTAGSDVLAHYLADGALDTTFGTAGRVATGLSTAVFGFAMDVAVQPDGRIVVAGVVDNGQTTGEDFAVRRYESSGAVDSGFGVDGLVMTDFAGGSDRAYAVAVQPDGMILVAGHAAEPGPDGADFALARYTPAGVPDETFNGDGTVTTNIAGAADFGFGLALQPDGKAVVVGRVSDSGGDGEQFGVARYLPDGALDTGFSDDGVTSVEFPFGAIAFGVAVDGGQRIVVVGQGVGETPTSRSDFVARSARLRRRPRPVLRW